MADLYLALIITAFLSALAVICALMLGEHNALSIALIVFGASCIAAGLLASAVRRGR